GAAGRVMPDGRGVFGTVVARQLVIVHGALAADVVHVAKLARTFLRHALRRAQPFGAAGQAIVLAGGFRKPSRIRGGIIPAHANGGMVAGLRETRLLPREMLHARKRVVGFQAFRSAAMRRLYERGVIGAG